MTSEADPDGREPGLPGTALPVSSPSPTNPPSRPSSGGLTPRARIALPICVVVLLGLTIHRLMCAPAEAQIEEFSGSTMGTLYSVKLAAPPLSSELRTRITEAIERELEFVDSRMSTWRGDSELSRFNQSKSTEPFPISPETFEVFRVAEEVSEASGGAFDVTVGPLVAAWGFGATDHLPEPPAPEELAALEGLIGHDGLHLEADPPSIAKRHPGMRCDLSAIAKGYAVDRVADALEDLGQTDYLVEIGGELRASGRKRDGTPWRVGIERPDTAERTSQLVLDLDDIGLATSGDYRNYYEADGVRISHTIDPRVRHPITHNLASVSVLHESTTRADALATALNVLGPEEGLSWATEHGLAAFFLVREAPGRFRSAATPAFDAYLARAEASAAGP